MTQGDKADVGEIINLLTAADQIAEGLATLALAIYDRDNRMKDQLAATNAASVQIRDALRGYEQALWEKSEVT